jgi:hypothetical protein
LPIQYQIYILLAIFLFLELILVTRSKIADDTSNGRNVRAFIAGQFVIGFVIVGCNLIINIRDEGKMTNIDDTTKNIDTTTKESKLIAKNIERLQQLDSLLTAHIDSITRDNNRLTGDVKSIVDNSKGVIKEIKNISENQIDENALSGKLELTANKPFIGDSLINISFGTLSTHKKANIYNNGKALTFLGFGNQSGDFGAITMKIVGNKILISVTIYDLFGNWIVDIVNNNWRRNPNNTGKFNYDKNGFEMIDNRNHVAFNFHIKSQYDILMSGYILSKETNQLFISGKSITIIKLNPSISLKQIEDEIKEMGADPIFEYTGEHWLHKRKKT